MYHISGVEVDLSSLKNHFEKLSKQAEFQTAVTGTRLDYLKKKWNLSHSFSNHKNHKQMIMVAMHELMLRLWSDHMQHK